VLPRAERREPEPWGHAVAPKLPRAGRWKEGAGITGTRSGLGVAPCQEAGVRALGHAGMHALSFVLSLYAEVSGLQGTDNSHFYSAIESSKWHRKGTTSYSYFYHPILTRIFH
jgi:hypothetical protein